MKKFKLFALTALLAMGTNAFAVDDAIDEGSRSVKGLTYSLKTVKDGDKDVHVATLIGVNSKATDDEKSKIVIPVTVPGDKFEYTVTAIAGDWAHAEGFADVRTLVTEITIPNTIKTVADNAFAGLVNTEKKTGLTTLVWHANDAIETIPAAFAEDSYLKNITIDGKKIKSVAAEAFKDANALEKIDLSGCPELETINEDAFVVSDKLKSVKLAGTKLTSINYFIAENKASATLEEVTLPAGLETIATEFKNKVALEAIDLSGTKVKAIPDNAFQVTGDVKDKEDKVIDPVLDKVKLNAETATIGKSAFAGQKALTTIENLNQAKLTAVGAWAFTETALKSIDLSATALTTISNGLFAGCPELQSVKLSDKITVIGWRTFARCPKLSSLNLENTKIETLEMLFTMDPNDEAAPCDALKSLTLPGTLKTISDYALQMTGLESITIPSSVTSFGANVLQGCVNLKNFTWEGAQVNYLDQNTFKGDDKLVKVIFLTNDAITDITSLNDDWFVGNSKDNLTVYVTAESYDQLVAKGWTEANAKYATLATGGDKTFEFNEKAKQGDWYYATYYNKDYATWFPETDFEVFTAIIDGSNVVLKKAETENGYYKIKQYANTYDDNEGRESVCVVRSKSLNPTYEVKAMAFNKQVSTLPTDNALLVASGDIKASRLQFQYKLGIGKDGSVKFWRVTSGTIKDTKVYLQTSERTKAREFFDIVVEGETTGINIVESQNEVETGEIYNLQGVRVNGAQKGIYIKNGKKFIVK